MGRLSLCVLLGLTLLAVSLNDVHVKAEVGPTESECRPYIEKAIHELKTGDSDGDENDDDSGQIDSGQANGDSKEQNDDDDDDDNDGVADDNNSTETDTKENDDNSEEKDKDENTASSEHTDEDDDDDDDSKAKGETAEKDDDDDDNSKENNHKGDDDNDDDDDNDGKDSGEKDTTEDSKEDDNNSGESDTKVPDDGDSEEDNKESNGKDDDDDDDDEDEKDNDNDTKENNDTNESGEDKDDKSKENDTNEADDDDDDDDDEHDSKELKETDTQEDDSKENDTEENDNKDDSREDNTEEVSETIRKKRSADLEAGRGNDDDADDDDDDDDDSKADSSEDKKTDEDDDDDNDSHEKDIKTESSEDNKSQDDDDDDDSKEKGDAKADSSEDNKSNGKDNDDDDDDDDDDSKEKDGAKAESSEHGKADDDDDDDSKEKDDAKAESSEDNKSDGDTDEDGDSKEDDAKVDVKKPDDNDDDDDDDNDDDDSEETRPEDDLLLEEEIPENLRDRKHIRELLHLDEEFEKSENAQERVAEIILRDIKRIYENAIKPLESLYKYRDLSNRHFGDPEIFSKPLVLFMGPWSGGKSSIINYLTDNEFKSNSLRTGAEPSPAYFNILMWGNETEVLDGTQLAADWTFSGLQKFGQGLEDRLRGLKMPSKLLEKVNIVEIPGILEVRKQVSRLFPFNDACQWFIDRADIIVLVYDPAKLDAGPETEAILDQLKGREYQTRIVLNKADTVKPEELLRVQSALIWNISPLMSSAQPPVMYTTSLWSRPYDTNSPVRLLQAQERGFLRDLRSAVDKRIENRIASARRFAVRVRNHAKMVDCYLNTYYNHKTIFGNKKKIADEIIQNPQNYHIYEGLSTLTNISRYDLPDPEVYRDFFRLNPLYEFKKLSQTCTYFRGCPIHKLDIAIAYDLPELVGKYKKMADQALANLDSTPDKNNNKS